ncbi:MAG TPA: SET domain-containing protein [Anaerolineales bacterium]|nr:SET domain-containing protein [Anaerolineales bacterium]
MFVIRTSLQHSAIHGIGVFADEPIQKGQLVWQFDPRVDILIPLEEKPSFPPAMQDYLSMLTYIEEASGRKMMVLCADNAKHVNHSDDPNLLDTPDGSQEIAAREIAAGEELTCNYFSCDLEAARKLGQT